MYFNRILWTVVKIYWNLLGFSNLTLTWKAKFCKIVKYNKRINLKAWKKTHMAAPVILTATTLEGQLLQMIEAVTNAQIMAVANAAPGATVRRIVASNNTDDINGIKTVSLSLPVMINVNALGTEVEAISVYI